MFNRVFIANRGEIAVRIIRCLREMGVESVVGYSDPDQYSMATQMADFAVPLNGTSSADTYLHIPKLIEAIKKTKSEAVHPGYGFLSENAEFAEAVKKTGAVFIGPSPQAIRSMGDKVEAKSIMQAQGIPIVPGVTTALEDLSHLKKAAKDIGFPLILKAAAGGGGRGMRVVHEESELEKAFEACKREAQAYFSNPAIFCERYIQNPRHIEFQVLLDHKQNGVHLFERDCSIQRRHQKLVEEAPSQYLNAAQREKLGALAVKAAQAVKYSGAGTVEFICESPDKAYFMEMNTRIQVEHPVTEAITGVDLIRQQLLVASGESLQLKQNDIQIRGWAIECRINAEDPAHDFRPHAGKVRKLEFPSGPFVRIDTYLRQGDSVPETYDSMIAKFIVWGEDRDQAIARMLRALAETRLEGIPTTIKFHEALFSMKDFRDSKFDTNFIEKNYDSLKTSMNSAENVDEISLLLASLLAQSHSQPVTLTGGHQNPVSQWQNAARREGVQTNS